MCYGGCAAMEVILSGGSVPRPEPSGPDAAPARGTVFPARLERSSSPTSNFPWPGSKRVRHLLLKEEHVRDAVGGFETRYPLLTLSSSRVSVAPRRTEELAVQGPRRGDVRPMGFPSQPNTKWGFMPGWNLADGRASRRGRVRPPSFRNACSAEAEAARALPFSRAASSAGRSIRSTIRVETPRAQGAQLGLRSLVVYAEWIEQGGPPVYR